MKITRKELAEANASIVPLVIFLSVLNGVRHEEPPLRSGALSVLLGGPFLALMALLASMDERRSPQASRIYAAIAFALALLWALSVKAVADMRGVAGPARLVFALETIGLLAIYLTLSLGLSLWSERRKKRLTKSKKP